MEYKTEAEFLKAYNKNDYDLISLTTDILILSVSNCKSENYRKLGEKYFSVLLVKRNTFPFKDKWCLPGGFLDVHKDLEENARDILAKETNLHNIFLEQLYTYGGLDRDPRLRVVSTSYMALIDKERLNQEVCPNAKWFNIDIKEKDDIVTCVLSSGEEELSFKIKKILKEQTTDRYKFEIIENESLAFDHPLIILSGIERLKNKIEYTDIVFNMMPKYFTLGELKQVYEVILNKKLLDPAFR
ncbi:MAG: NrtR DNA-binding winged helix domain-containing protein, partial [Christensenellales bacterium]